MESVYTEVTSTRLAGQEEVETAVVRLVSEGLAESRLHPEDGRSETIFIPSKKAAKLRGRIPQEPQTVTEFYL
jgi:hypothetical protein